MVERVCMVTMCTKLLRRTMKKKRVLPYIMFQNSVMLGRLSFRRRHPFCPRIQRMILLQKSILWSSGIPLRLSQKCWRKSFKLIELSELCHCGRFYATMAHFSSWYVCCIFFSERGSESGRVHNINV